MSGEKEFGFDISTIKVYSGYYKDNEILKLSSSGGGASAIAEQFINRGGVVFGVKYTDDFRNAEFCFVDKASDLYKIKGSKYIDSKKIVCMGDEYSSVYKAVMSQLLSGKRVLFIGLGCDVAAVKKWCETQLVSTDNLYTMDLICHGPTSAEIAKQYLDGLENKYDSKITDFTVRYKKSGWVPPYIRVVFESGEIFEEPFDESDYGKAFYIYSKAACYNCQFKGKKHYSDLTVGDYWGMEKKEPAYNEFGVSIFILNNSRGKELMEMIDESAFYLQEADIVRALRGNPSFYICRSKAECYHQFEQNLKTFGLHYAVTHSVNVTKKLKQILIKIVPDSVIIVTKRLYKFFLDK